jgi:STE24 endopeptidase
MAVADTPLTLDAPSPEVKRYQRLKLCAGVTATVLELAFLASMAFVWGPALGDTLATWLGDRGWLLLVTVAAVVGIGCELLTLPIAFWSSYLVEHRYQLSNQTIGAWIRKRIKGYLVGGILGLLLLSGLYWILWTAGSAWWLWATAGWLLVTLVLGRLMPVLILPLFYKVTPFDDPQLLERLRRLTDGTGLTIEGVYRLHLSAETRKANAALAGLGKSRRVLLGDTLLEQFTPDEIEVVFAHEVGHHVHRHLAKMIIISVVLSLAGFGLVDLILRSLAPALGYAGLADPAALPLLLLVLAAFGLLMSPLQNALSRFFERQCDGYALQRTGHRDAYRAAFIKLAKINKSDPDPHPLVVSLFYDHPPIRARLAMAEFAADVPARDGAGTAR